MNTHNEPSAEALAALCNEAADMIESLYDPGPIPGPEPTNLDYKIDELTHGLRLRAAEFAALRAELKQWREACQELAPEIETPDLVSGWLVNVNDVSDAIPPDIKKHGCAQSPMEWITQLVDSRDALRARLERAAEAMKGVLKAREADEPWFYSAEMQRAFRELAKAHAQSNGNKL